MPRDQAVAEAPPREEQRSAGASRIRSAVVDRPEFGALIATVAVFVFFAVWADNFLTVQSAGSTLVITAELAIVAMAVTLLMIAGEFDLSVGSVLGVSSLSVPWLMIEQNLTAGSAVFFALLLAALIGFVNGFVVIKTRIPSFIVTLGALLFWRGVLFVVTGGFPLSIPVDSVVFSFFSASIGSSFNVSLIWFLGLCVIFSFLLLRLKQGNWIFAAGGNERAARSMGVPVDRLRLGLFMLTAFCAGLAGVIQAGRFSSVDALRGEGLELEAIAAAVIGGARLNGGYGSIVGTALGCLMVGMIRNGLVLAGVSSYWYEAIIGLLVVAAVIVNHVAGRAGASGASA